jgi:membrane-bound lytic murein transglycosylase B
MILIARNRLFFAPFLGTFFVVFSISAAVLFVRTPLADAQTALTPQQKAALQAELAQVEADQKQAAADLAGAQSQSASLSRDISILNAKIKTAQLNIKAKNLLIQTLGNDITQKQGHIDALEARIAKGKTTLGAILRKTNEIDASSLPEVILSQTSVAGFFGDLDTFQSVQEALKATFEQLRSDEASTSAEKNALETRKNSEEDARYAIQQEQKNIQSDENQKQQLLATSKGNEKSYSTLLAQKQARAAQIRAQLFSLRDAAAIPFGQALQYATLASQKTGVRPAFLLAVITQESALGKNVGQCYVTNMQNGDGIGAKSGNPIAGVMNPTRDIPAFKQILDQIGGDVTKQVVSCPLDIGWGGAMGPAQFIPSTWLLFDERIAQAVGISGMPDPWNPAHAFMASAIYLGDLGASGQTYTAERNAACKYYSGRSCGAVRGNTSYGNSVVAQADTIQRTMIDPLTGL